MHCKSIVFRDNNSVYQCTYNKKKQHHMISSHFRRSWYLTIFQYSAFKSFYWEHKLSLPNSLTIPSPIPLEPPVTIVTLPRYLRLDESPDMFYKLWATKFRKSMVLKNFPQLRGKTLRGACIFVPNDLTRHLLKDRRHLNTENEGSNGQLIISSRKGILGDLWLGTP